MKVLKFGGSVLKNAEDIENIKNIVIESAKSEDKIVAVFSAFYGITDKLIDLGITTAKGENYLKKLDSIKDFHYNIAQQLKLNDKDVESIDKLFKKIENTLLIIQDREKLLDDTKDYLITFGERLSNHIIYLYLKKTEDVIQISPCEIIKTNSNFGNAKVDIEQTNKCIVDVFSKINNKIVICAGFIGSNDNGQITTLGRNGSDYSASLIASALKVKQLEIWKDIDGLCTADPKIVDNVKFIKQISYQEMAELSSLGNKVLHINAIAPCISENIPILLKNCYNKTAIGTFINNQECRNYYINGIVKCDNVVILRYKLTEFINMTDFAIRLQKILQNFEDAIITISQNIKQKVVSIIILENRIEKLEENINNEFKIELEKKDFAIEIGKTNSMITIVGADLSGVVGISGKIFNTLQKNNINIDAIHDDFSSTRISFLCDVKDANNVVKLLHKELVE